MEKCGIPEMLCCCVFRLVISRESKFSPIRKNYLTFLDVIFSQQLLTDKNVINNFHVLLIVIPRLSVLHMICIIALSIKGPCALNSSMASLKHLLVKNDNFLVLLGQIEGGHFRMIIINSRILITQHHVLSFESFCSV